MCDEPKECSYLHFYMYEFVLLDKYRVDATVTKGIVTEVEKLWIIQELAKKEVTAIY